MPVPVEDSLAILLLPGRLEDFELAAHARDLLEIPRVVALEPSRVRTPKFLREAAPLRQARKLRFPGHPRLVLLYHPAQYPLGRALVGEHDVELWYAPPELDSLPPAGGVQRNELLQFDELARGLARQIVPVTEDGEVQDGALRMRLRELEVISPHAFVPRTPSRRSRRQ
jgi:hypothetical protein